MKAFRILLIGAGAVGRVYGYHLQRGGAYVAFLVRPAALASCAEGMTLYPIRSRGDLRPIEFRADAVLSSLDDVAAQRWDQVWLCVSAAALDDAWLASIAAAVGDALIVALPPGIDSEARIRKAFVRNDVVPALIGLISYQAPLPKEEVPRPGIAYLFPMGNPSAFGGERGSEAARALTRGDCPAVENRDIATTSAFGSALLMPNIAALELEGWSLSKLRRGRWIALAAEAARQGIRVSAARLDVQPPLFLFLLLAISLRIVWTIAPWVIPIDLETYLRYHFSKVGAQTRLLLSEMRREGEARGLETSAIAALVEALPPMPPHV